MRRFTTTLLLGCRVCCSHRRLTRSLRAHTADRARLHRDPATGGEVRAGDRHLLEQRLRLRGPVHRRRLLHAEHGTASSAQQIQGRERLAEVSGGGSRGCKNVGWIKQGVKHLYVNHIISAYGRRRDGHGRHADDWPRRRSQQDPPRRVLRGHLREDASGLALQVAHAPCPDDHATGGGWPASSAAESCSLRLSPSAQAP